MTEPLAKLMAVRKILSCWRRTWEAAMTESLAKLTAAELSPVPRDGDDAGSQHASTGMTRMPTRQ
jgi:hypothetical protein